MEKVIYDLHTHSALSPCGDNDMTVNNMLNMAVLNGIQVMAITDHNSCKNCPAAMEVAKELPIDLIPDGILPVIGFTDDIAVMTLVISMIKDSITPEIKARANERVAEIMGTGKV